MNTSAGNCATSVKSSIRSSCFKQLGLSEILNALSLAMTVKAVAATDVVIVYPIARGHSSVTSTGTAF